MVIKLKKKKKISTTALVNKILKIDADAQGLTLVNLRRKEMLSLNHKKNTKRHIGFQN